jgi:hypothetical protein
VSRECSGFGRRLPNLVALYRDGGVSGRGPLWAIALAVLGATVVCWVAAAQWGRHDA